MKCARGATSLMRVHAPAKKRSAFFLLFLFFLYSNPTDASLLPAADREGSERFFSVAYDNFLKRAYAPALENLDNALKLNTYFVDYYLMRGLVLHRLGRTDEAVKSIRYYLEVRPRDSAAPRILERYRNEQLFVNEFLTGEPLQSTIISSVKDVKKAFSLGILQTLGVRGLGKVASYADGVFLADTLGNRVGFRLPGEDLFQFLEIQSPVVALPAGNKSFYVISETGDVFHLPEGERMPVSLGKLPVEPSDGALITSGLLAVSSAVTRGVFVYSLPELNFAGKIDFPEGERLFEPVALSVYGGWLAVADRSNGKVHIQSIQDRSVRFSLEAEAPRDLAWSSFGDLFILHESGGVSRARISFTRRTAIELENVLSETHQGWSLFPIHDRIYCLDISASRLWEMFPVPYGESFAMLSLFSPAISREQDRESFVLAGTVSGPFRTYMSMNAPVVTSVWNERLLGGNYIPSVAAQHGATLYFKPPQPVRLQGEGTFSAASGKDVVNALMEAWDARKGDLANIVVAASTPFSFEEILQLAGFCLQNRVRIFVYADGIPSIELLRAAALTCGSETFVPNGTWGPLPPYSSGSIRIVLPADETSSGFPSRSTLSVYLDIGVVPTRDWVPLWPDLL